MRGLKWLRPKHPSWQSRWSASLLNPPTGMVHASLPKPILIIFTRRLLKISPRSTTSALAMQRRLKNTQHNSHLSTCSVSMKYLEAGNKPGILISPLAACWTGFESSRPAGQPWQRQTHNLHWDRGWNASENGSKINQNQLQNIAAFSSRFPSRGAACHIAVAAFQFQFPSFLSTVFLPFSVSHMNRHASRMPVFFRLLEQKNDKKNGRV